jgi:death-on-curing protein
MKAPIWITKAVILAVHDEQLAEHGGGTGLRDEGLLDSALARPQNRHGYDSSTDLCALAAAYAFGIARNHPFIDGNKRTAFVASELFLELNGVTLGAEDGDCVIVMLRLAAGEIGEDEFADWLRTNTR